MSSATCKDDVTSNTMAKTLLFISDTHLHATDSQLTEHFVNFLETRAFKADALYILGDLFDLWVGDDDQSQYNRKIIQALRQLTKNGTKFYFQRGNRDFLIGTRFAKETGCEILEETHVLLTENTRALLMHGDSLCWDDVDYQKTRKIMRDPKWQANLLKQPLNERYKIADQYRQASQTSVQQKSMQMMDVTHDAVAQIMSQHQVSLLIHGHTHRPAEHQLSVQGKSLRRIVLGDWRAKRPAEYLEYRDGAWLRQTH